MTNATTPGADDAGAGCIVCGAERTGSLYCDRCDSDDLPDPRADPDLL